ncbi:MAG TPA: YciI family protein [Candidatus Dormibacteraeota bacterium]
MMRYLLVVNFKGGVVDTPMEEWRPEEITAHLDYYKALHKELVSSGELVDSQVLAGPNLAKIVTSDGLTAPMVTDGPFQEFKEWLAGYQIVDVESEARAIEIAGKISAVPGPGGIATQQPIQVRQVMDQAPSDVAEMEAFLQQVGDQR